MRIAAGDAANNSFPLMQCNVIKSSSGATGDENLLFRPAWFAYFPIAVIHGKVESHTSQEGPHGRSLSRFLEHEATESIATPPGWDASPSQGYP